MGLNYHCVVSALLEFRSRLEEFSTLKNQALIQYFKETEYNLYDDAQRDS